MKQVIKNWSYLLVSNITQQLLVFLVVIMLARKLSPSGYGEFNVIISIAAIITVISNIGMGSVIIREIALVPMFGRTIVALIIPVRLISFLVALLFLVFYAVYSNGAHSFYVLFCIAFIVFNLSIWDISESVAFGNKATKYSSYLNIAFSFSWFLAVSLFPERFFSLEAVLYVYCLMIFSKSFIYLWIAKTNFLIHTHSLHANDLTVTRQEILNMSWPYLWTIFVFTASSQLPVQFLNVNANTSEVAFYSIGNKLMIPVVLAISTANSAIFPFFTGIFKKNENLFRQYIKDGMCLIISFGTMIAILLSLTSHFWITILFGYDYNPAIAVFNVLVWYAVISVIDSLLSLSLSSSYRQNTLSIIATIDIAIMLPMIFIGSFNGAYGISIMKLTAGILIAIYHIVIFIKVIKIEIRKIELFNIYSFFIVSMALCIIIEDNTHKAVSVLLFIILNFIIKESPVRLSLEKVYGNLKPTL